MNDAKNPVPILQARSRLCVVVAGMHRSGTSAVARMVNLLGADIARDLMPPKPGNNERGFWESPVIMSIHDRLLGALGSAWDDPFPLPAGWLDTDAAHDAQRDLADEIRRDFDGSNFFVVKDPRIARLLPLWLRLLDDLAIEPIVVIPVRNPLEVAMSLQNRDQLIPAKSSVIYLRSCLEAELTSRGRRRLFIRFDRLLNEWRHFASDVAGMVGPILQRSTAENAREIDDFLTADLYHNRSSSEELADLPNVAASIVEMFDILSRAADTGNEEALRASCDRLRGTLAEATKLFHGLVIAERDGARARVEELDAALGDLRGHSAALETTLGVQSAELAAARGQTAALETALGGQSAELAAARSQIGALETSHAARSTELLEAYKQIATLKIVLDARSAVLGTVRKQVDQLARALDARERQFRAMRRSVSWLSTKPLRVMSEGGRWIAYGLRRGATLIWWALTLQLGERRRRDRQLRADVKLIADSGLFDRDWYLDSNPGVSRRGDGPAAHYLRRGAFEGRDPNPLFDSDWYLDRNPRIRDAGMNPLMHYLQRGADEGLDPNPLFDTDWYLAQNQDVRDAGVNPLVHYLQHGAAEGRDPNPSFDSQQYFNQYQDVLPAVVNPLAHYLQSSVASGCGLSPSHQDPPTTNVRGPAKRVLARLFDGVSRDGGLHARRPDFVPPKPIDRYAAWLACNAPHERAEQMLREALTVRRGRLPRISVIMPVFNTPSDLLKQAVDSVLHQVYDDWELCIANDASTDPAVAQSLARWAAADDRIRIVHRERNGGIGAATNSAASVASGDFLAFLDHDDLLTPDALGEIAIHAADYPETDIIYTDDDKIDMTGRRFAPQFKPEWSPILLLSYMYMGHLLVIRRNLFEALGAIREGFDGSQDYDLALRAVERARRVGHIPRVLYHWRVTPNSTAASTDAKPDSLVAGLRAVAEAFARRGLGATASHSDWAKTAKVGMFAASFPDEGPRVSILIPTRNRLDLLKSCLNSLANTTYRNYDVVILDNESDDPATLAFLSSCGHRVLRIGCPGGKFSFAHINNIGVGEVETDYVLFLNNDTEVISLRWLSQMMGYARMPSVGAVGAKLIYRDGTVQHAGIVHGYHDGTAGHAFKNMPAADWGYLGYLRIARECLGVTAACLLTPRALFLELGGFDETAFAVAYNDVDYCYRLNDRGYGCVICPDATLIHDEGKSRGFDDNPAEIAAFRKRHRGRRDPYYNPNLSLDNEHFEIHPYRHPPPDSEPVRVIAVSNNLNHEGAPNSQLELIVGLKRRGVLDPVVLAPQDGPLRSMYEAAGIPVQIVSPPIVGGISEFERTSADFARAIRESGVDVVYANTLDTFWAIAAAKAAEVPALWNVRESAPWKSYFDNFSPEMRVVAYGCFRYPYRIVFVSDASRRVWEPLNSCHNFTMIHNGPNIEGLRTDAAVHDRVAVRAELGIGDNELVIVLVGTVCERKGQLDLVHAIGLLSVEARSKLRIFIVGDRASEYSSRLHEEANALPPDIAARLTIVPETGDPHRYYHAADIAVCSSRIESYPRVILEAMAFGLPIITTPVFGIAEQVRDRVNGLFYKPGDALELANHLARLISDDTLRARLGANSLSVLESLPGIGDMLDGYGRLFREARLSGSVDPHTAAVHREPS